MIQNKNKSPGLILISVFAAAVVLFSGSGDPSVQAAEPAGADFFEFRASPFTGKDNSGDGDTGNADDLNYYYVGQSFDGAMKIKSAGTTAANIIVNYDSTLAQAANLLTGAYFSKWSGQTIQSGKINSTGYNLPVVSSTGLGDFGSVRFTMLKPTAANYVTGAPAILDINTGTIGMTTESNIALNGADLLDEAEDFRFHIWADTKKPYAKNSLPASGATDVPVDSLYKFDLRDSLRGEGDDSGAGTGVNVNSAAADITFDMGAGAFSLKQNAAYTCSGVWGTNLCEVTVTRPPITSYTGDARRWQYNSTYTVKVKSYQDLASSSQNQLGDANGPNTMDEKTFTFRTIADTVAPRLFNISPTPDSIDQSLGVNILFDFIDRKEYPNGFSGSGLKSGTCRIDVSSPSFSLKTYKSGDAEFTIADIDYGNRIVIDPAKDFVSDEAVTVKIYGCEDNGGNKIADKTFIFKTVILDTDGDGVLDASDNCPNTANADQKDIDKDGTGDACDTDLDGDTVLNTADNCPNTANADQKDTDKDGTGDACDTDLDGDTVLNTADNCPNTANADQKDTDKDGAGDVCEDDIDGDTVLNSADNCPLVPNTDQKDTDKDGAGDVCDDDLDGDTITNIEDNCVYAPNTDQKDTDKDGAGDACDEAAGAVSFSIKAKPERRVIKAGNQDLSMNAALSFLNRNTNKADLTDKVILGNDGTYKYTTEKLGIGSYDIALKGESYLRKYITDIVIGKETVSVDLDYTFGGTVTLTAGDIREDNIINSFDLTTMLGYYGKKTSGLSDLNKDGYVSSFDMALLVRNYFKKGE